MFFVDRIIEVTSTSEKVRTIQDAEISRDMDGKRVIQHCNLFEIGGKREELVNFAKNVLGLNVAVCRYDKLKNTHFIPLSNKWRTKALQNGALASNGM